MRIFSKQNNRRAATLVDLMVSVVIFSGVMLGGMAIASKLKKAQVESEIQARLTQKGAELSIVLQDDFENIIQLTGVSNEGTHYQALPWYSLMRSPDAAPGDETWDGFRIVIADDSYSSAESFELVSVASGGGVFTGTVNGDLTSFRDDLPEDLIVISSPDETEIYEIDADTISYNSGTNQSTFQTAQNLMIFEDQTTNPQLNGSAYAYRVRTKTYRIGNGSDEATGLFVEDFGNWRLLARDVISMQTYYQLEARESAASSDCSSKSNSRYFSHAANDAQCDWNDIRTLRLELLLSSGASSQESLNPHTNVEDDSIKVLYQVLLTPSGYRESLVN